MNIASSNRPINFMRVFDLTMAMINLCDAVYRLQYSYIILLCQLSLYDLKDVNK